MGLTTLLLANCSLARPPEIDFGMLVGSGPACQAGPVLLLSIFHISSPRDGEQHLILCFCGRDLLRGSCFDLHLACVSGTLLTPSEIGVGWRPQHRSTPPLPVLSPDPRSSKQGDQESQGAKCSWEQSAKHIEKRCYILMSATVFCSPFWKESQGLYCFTFCLYPNFNVVILISTALLLSNVSAFYSLCNSTKCVLFIAARDTQLLIWKNSFPSNFISPLNCLYPPHAPATSFSLGKASPHGSECCWSGPGTLGGMQWAWSEVAGLWDTRGREELSPVCRTQARTLQGSELNLNSDLFPLSAVIHNRHLLNPSWWNNSFFFLFYLFGFVLFFLTMKPFARWKVNLFDLM